MLLAAVLRFHDLDQPPFKIFDEDFYVTDACAYVTEGQAFCGDEEATWAHPPAGKWMIAAGIWGFTPTAFGSRVMVAVFGTLSVGLLFLLALKLLRSVLGGVIAAVLLALDPLHLVISRIGILEVFASFFVLAAFVCFVIDRDQRTPAPAGPDDQVPWFKRDVPWGRFVSRWRLLGGIMLGLATATKWTVAPVVPMIAILIVAGRYRAEKASRVHTKPFVAAVTSEARSILVTLIFVPAAVYSLTFVGRIDGSFLVQPWSNDSWYRALLEQQISMWDYHLELRRFFTGERAPFHSSPAWSWPLIQRPIPLAFWVRDGMYRQVLAVGNPVTWWPGIIAALAVGLAAPGRGKIAAAGVVWAGFAGTYLYWLALGPGVTNIFIYYFVQAVPFLYIAIAVLTVQVAAKLWGRVLLGGYLAAVSFSFAFLYPVLTWRPLTPDQWRMRVPFTQCEHFDAGESDVVAGYPFPIDDPFGFPILAYPEGVPEEEFVPLLTSRDGWCWR